MKARVFLTVLVLSVLLMTPGMAQGPGPQMTVTAPFTYQGVLRSNNNPVSGTCDFQFSLWDAQSGGSQVGATWPQLNVPVTRGLFTVVLQFGATPFQGANRYLEVAVRCPAGSGAYTTLSPRQELTPTPYATYAYAAHWANLLGVPVGFADNVDNDTTYTAGAGLILVGTQFSVVFAGTGAANTVARSDHEHDARYWKLGGNSGTTPSVNYLGTSDNTALELKVNNLRALRLEPSAISPNVVGGYPGNNVIAGGVGGTVGGGGAAGATNRVTDSFGVVGGGANNQAGNGNVDLADATYATVGGGQGNTAGAPHATVAGGNGNSAQGSASAVGGGAANQAQGNWAVVSGGWNNTASAPLSTVGGGYSNSASDERATVAGGSGNMASAYAATVGGGYQNRASATRATVGGGSGNTASGIYTTVSGGYQNAAIYQYASVGGGHSNVASGSYAAVAGGLQNVASGQWSAIPGGSSNEASANYTLAAGRHAKATSAGCFVWGDSTDADVVCSDTDRFIARASGGVYFYTNSALTSGMYLAAGGSSWNAVSDRSLKENFAPVDGREVLRRLANISITTWNYKAQDPAIRHIGPMAQDFNRLVDGLGGEGETYINTLDADGVALAAIQGLYQENLALRQRVTDLEARVAALEALVAQQASQQGGAR